jgi:hypothetical protein
MKRLERARRTAEQVLRDHSATRVPVQVEEIAKNYAHVVRDSMDEDLSGILIPLPEPKGGKKWAIAVNAAHPRVRQRFTIAHELGHLLMHGFTSAHADRGYRLRFRNQKSAEGSVFEEIEANQFAAELLMPAELLLRELANRQLEYVPTGNDQSDMAFSSLAKQLDVSTQALAIRLSNLLL